MSTHEDRLLAARFAALAPDPLSGDWDDVLSRAGAARKHRRRLGPSRAHQGSRRRRFVVLAAAALVVVVGAASAFGTVRDLLFGTTRSATYSHPSWSPDGRTIAFTVFRWPDGAAELFLMNADGSRQRTLKAAGQTWGQTLAWSPDGRKLAFVRERDRRNDDVYIINADGSAQRRLARGVRRTVNVTPGPAPAWSPDGRRIAFVSDRDDGTFAYTRDSRDGADVYVMNADGSRQRRLTRNAFYDGAPTWSPDGQRIAFVSTRDGNQEIYVMNADGSGQWNLTQGPGGGSSPAWSPDGQRIAFRSLRDGNGEIYVVNTDGRNVRRLTRNPDSDGGPVWSPDGQKILFVRAEYRQGNSEIFVTNADGSGQRNLTRNPAPDGSPAWSPDGRKIVFVSKRDRNGEVYTMNADGSGQLNLTRLKGED
jgi:Tol biopolymer transport system component